MAQDPRCDYIASAALADRLFGELKNRVKMHQFCKMPDWKSLTSKSVLPSSGRSPAGYSKTEYRLTSCNAGAFQDDQCPPLADLIESAIGAIGLESISYHEHHVVCGSEQKIRERLLLLQSAINGATPAVRLLCRNRVVDRHSEIDGDHLRARVHRLSWPQVSENDDGRYQRPGYQQQDSASLPGHGVERSRFSSMR